MSRPSKTEQEMGYLRDWWTEVRTMEAEYNGVFSMIVTPTGRPGVMTFRMMFVPLQEAGPNSLGSFATSFTYPVAEQSTFAGYMWRKSIALGRMVAEGRATLRPKNGREG